LQSTKQFTVASGSDGDSNLNALGLSVGTFGGASNGLKIAAVDVSTLTGAQSAISAIDAALTTVSLNQSKAGAFINRLNDIVTNQTSMQSNMTTSRSAIQDTDYSSETTNLAKSQIISQAATAMLAQANQSSQNVLALLK
jgi:flagellin